MSLIERLTRRKENLRGVKLLSDQEFMATFTNELYAVLGEAYPEHYPVTGDNNNICNIVNAHAAKMLKEQYGIRAQLYVKRGWDQRRTNRNSINHAFLKIRSGFKTIILDFSYKQIAEGTQEKPDYLLVRYNNEHQRTKGLRQYGYIS